MAFSATVQSARPGFASISDSFLQSAGWAGAFDLHACKRYGEKIMAEKTTDSGLKYEELVEGDGSVAENGQQVTVHYTGWLTDGSKFDSSVDRNQPFEFSLGRGMVIRGWDEGVAGMKIGEKRKLTIPPHLGYGAQGAGGVIPPNSTLVFEVELLGIR